MKIGKTGFIIIGVVSAIALVGGIIAYISYRKSNEADKVDENIPDETKQPDTPSGGDSAPQIANPLGDKTAVKKFQDWLDVKHPGWLNNGKSLNKGTGYGNFGSQTARAWNKWGSDYKKNLRGRGDISTGWGSSSGSLKTRATDTDKSKELEYGMKGKRVAALQFMLNYVYGFKSPVDGVYGSSTRSNLKYAFGYAIGNSVDKADMDTLRIKAVTKAGSIAALTSKMASDPNYVKTVNSFI